MELCVAGLPAALTMAVARVSPAAQEPVRLYAAGSLRVALTEVADAFEKQEGIPVRSVFGASGLLRERIEKGEPAEVFASADMGHPQTLARAGRSGPVFTFTRNRLCALVSPGVEVTAESLLGVLLDPKVRVGTSTPRNDPSGDYAWMMFEKAGKLHPGACASLCRKALKLVSTADTPQLPKSPDSQSVYTTLMIEGRADVFITYCTNAMLARREAPVLKVVQLPEALAVNADYGMTVMNDASAGADRLAKFILSDPAQEILARNGFATRQDKEVP